MSAVTWISLGFSLYSPVSALANLIAMVTGMPGAALPGSEALRIARAVGMVVAALTIGWLLLTPGRTLSATIKGAIHQYSWVLSDVLPEVIPAFVTEAVESLMYLGCDVFAE